MLALYQNSSSQCGNQSPAQNQIFIATGFFFFFFLSFFLFNVLETELWQKGPPKANNHSLMLTLEKDRYI